MRNTILFIAVILIISCKDKKEETPTAEVGTHKIIAVRIMPDTIKNRILALYRTIGKTITYDSTEKKDEIIVDTIWNEELSVAVKNSTGKDTIEFRYLSVPKDSVNWHVENIDVDSLVIIKKR